MLWPRKCPCHVTNPCPQNREASISDSLMNVLRAVLRCFSRVRLFTTLWTVGGQVPLSMGILQARILEWVAMPASRASTQGSNPRLLCLLHWQVFFVVVFFFTASTTWEASQTVFKTYLFHYDGYSIGWCHLYLLKNLDYLFIIFHMYMSST